MSPSDEPTNGVGPLVEPARMLDDPSSPSALRDALSAARDDLPDDARMAAIAARLGPLLGPDGGSGPEGGGGAPSPSPPIDPSAIPGLAHGGFWKAALLVAASASAIVGASLVTRETPIVPPRERPAPEATAIASPRSLEAPTAMQVAPETMPITPSRPRIAPIPRLVPEPAPLPVVAEEPPPPDPARELTLIRDAQAALRSSPARALELTEEHRRSFGGGPLSQEREVIAIDALIRMGSVEPARRRADAFRARYAGSAYVRRIDVLVPP